MMKMEEFQELINKAVSDGDFVTGLAVAAARYKENVPRLSREEKIGTLRLIRGFATQIMNNELGNETKRESGEVRSCDYCGRNAENAQLFQGHSGAICNVCVGTLFQHIDN